jgi:D-serine deaminase-like pyridoxal phosphate-dependent protein
MFEQFRSIEEPYLAVNEEQVRANISAMALRFRDKGIAFRPHFKTHQSLEVGRWFKDEGVESITVSSVKMALSFALDGWKDITLGIPFQPGQAFSVKEIASLCHLNLIVDDASVLPHIPKISRGTIGVFIKINAGYKRAGLLWTNEDAIEKLLLDIKTYSHLRFIGFLAHDGHTYKAGSREEIRSIRQISDQRLGHLKSVFNAHNPIISVGDTPSCSLNGDFNEVDEVRPGNFVFYDMQQHVLGSCEINQIAAALVCPVLAVYPSEGRIIIHGGAVHLSKDMYQQDKEMVFGKLMLFENGQLIEPAEAMFVNSLSQEHGMIYSSLENLKDFRPGQSLAILSAHICLTVACQRRYSIGAGNWTNVI